MPEFFLDHLQGERAGVADRFGKEVVTVGRSDECDLCFEEMGISWEHAEVRHRDGDWWVIDHGSTNGSYVNDERAHNARLQDGDLLRFGKKGPVMRFRLQQILISESSGEAPKAPPSRSKKRKPRLPSEAEIPVLRPEDLEPQGVNDGFRPGDRHSDLPPAAALLGVGQGGVSNYVVLGLGLALLASLVLLGLLFVEYQSQETALLKHEARSAALKRDVESLKQEVVRRETKARQLAEERAREEQEVSRGIVQRHKREAERARRVVEENQARIGRLERSLTNSRRMVARLRAERNRWRRTPRRSRDPKSWKEIERSLNSSVLFIATVLKGKRKKDGKIIPLTGFGTGFFASSQGHIVTNKHVIQPWKFRRMATKLAKEGIEVDKSSYQVHVWRAGTRLIRRHGARKVFDTSTGFSTGNGTLEIVRTAPDRWQDIRIGGKGPRLIRIHSDSGNNDLAILRARATRVIPIPIGKSRSLEKLDEVLVVGFPAGPSIFETNRCETSPAKGTVRKIETTILVSAAMIPGNSGGPLIDSKGRVVGVCTRRRSETLGFCIKIEHAMTLLHGGTWK